MQSQGWLWATVDRLEVGEEGEQKAVLVFDDGQQLVLPVDALPAGALPNRVLRVSIRVDERETERRAREISDLQRGLFGE